MATRTSLDLIVEKSWRLTPNMQRVVFTGDDLIDFPSGMESGYLKLLFPNTDVTSPKKNLVRTYTIRSFDPVTHQLAMDFALHEHSEGPASSWAKGANKGDRLQVQGPGPAKLVDFEADWFFLVGDMTSLPALSCNLEKMPNSAKGYAIVQVNSDEDRQDLKRPAGMELEWVINPHPHMHDSTLEETVKSRKFLTGKPAIWVACEFSNMRNLRTYFKDECKIDKNHIYISSYWKIDSSEDQHREHKSKDAKRQMGLAERLGAIVRYIRKRILR